jgi:hypothetical protein
MAGPSKKPAKLKILSGTNQPCRAQGEGVDLPATDSVPDPPGWLPNAHAVVEWNRLAPTLHNVGLLTQVGTSVLGVLCGLHGKIVQLFAAGECPTGHMLAQYRALVNDFGMTPAAQGKVKQAGETKKGNKFANNGPKAVKK